MPDAQNRTNANDRRRKNRGKARYFFSCCSYTVSTDQKTDRKSDRELVILRPLVNTEIFLLLFAAMNQDAWPAVL